MPIAHQQTQQQPQQKQMMQPPQRKNTASEYYAKHVIIAGGSDGLGLCLAKILAGQGANITIFARRKSRLEEAIAEIREYSSVLVREQRILGFPVDCTDCPALRNAVSTAITRHEEEAPAAFFCCVGCAKPAGFLDLNDSDFESQMKTNYLSAVYCARAVIPEMLKANRKCRLVLVSSIAGLIGFAGYASYAPCKAALKCLGDCLRNELVGTNVSVHVFLPASFSSPGYDEEMRIKPELTREIEASDPVISAPKCAEILLRGIQDNLALITTSATGELVRCAGLVHTPPNNTVFDFIKVIVAYIVLNFWRRTELDVLARKHPIIKNNPSASKLSKKAI